ncbi:hypothetical protein ILYODFUR_031377 [Ilyodon furcidens]|uniref:Secreted protein n=1 Tax=Ilyodon furcidens TaxID=33524 RepID=A0ABV0T396_9TELE
MQLSVCELWRLIFTSLTILLTLTGGKINVSSSPAQWPVVKRNNLLCHAIFSHTLQIRNFFMQINVKLLCTTRVWDYVCTLKYQWNIFSLKGSEKLKNIEK